MEELQKRIQYLQMELAARDRQDGWVVEGLRTELERLKVKAKKLEKAK
tara:strand:- start:2552 stop:2695 length:144 start_codon:yes stop_codon:yes gene_type:complete